MCGRISLYAPPEELAARFDADLPADRSLEPRYNVSPGQPHPVVRDDSPETFSFPEWGLVPSWADDPSIGSSLFNARAETLTEKPSFSDAFRERRCLVPASGFFDWKETPTGKQPYHIRLADGEPFALAGLWATWRGDGETRTTFTIVTTEPNDLVAPIHHRMPVLLAPDEERAWLESDDETELRALLDPYPGDEMEAYPVSERVNSPGNDSPAIIEAVAAEEDVQTGLGDFG